MARNALITGASGFLGRQVLQSFRSAGWNTFGTGFTRADPPTILKVDLTDSSELLRLLHDVQPDVIVHCAANRFPDKCEQDPATAKQINVDASKQLAQAAARSKILLIYISTDYVFRGSPGEAPYEAGSTPHPSNIYGQTKLDGETAVLEATQDSGLGLVLRVPVLYGPTVDPKESAVNVLLDTLWRAQGTDTQIKMDNWAQRYPTNTEDVGRVCLDVATSYLDNPEIRQTMSRVLQFSSEDRFTKYQMCQLFADIMGLPLAGLIPENQGGDPTANVQRPYDTHLSTRALENAGINIQTQDFQSWWRWQVKAFRK